MPSSVRSNEPASGSASRGRIRRTYLFPSRMAISASSVGVAISASRAVIDASESSTSTHRTDSAGFSNGFETDQVKRMLDRVYKKAAKPKDGLAEAQKASQAELEKVLKSTKA